MGNQPRTFLLWLAVPAGLLLLLVFMPKQGPGPQDPRTPAAGAPAAAGPAQPGLGAPAEGASRIFDPQTPAPTAAKKPGTLIGGTPLSDDGLTVEADALAADTPSVNAPMTDAEIMAGIQQQKLRKEALKKTLAQRDAKAAQVRYSAETSQGPSDNTPVEGTSGAVAPPEIMNKLKNHELVAH